MTSAANVIARIRSLGASLSLDGPRLIVDAPRGVITRELREEIVRLKPAILAELSAGADRLPRDAVHQVAGLLAIAYRRHRDACTGPCGSAGQGDSRLANFVHQSVHGGDA